MLELPLVTYVATMSVTPGPNNLMLASSGVNFGFRRTLPHLLGVNLGHSFQVALMALAATWATAWLQALRVPLVVCGCAYLLWLAWRQAQSARPSGEGDAAPLGFLAAALFQWVNPKAWMMVLNVGLLFLPREATWTGALRLAWICALVNLPCIALWAIAGDRLRRLLARPLPLAIFNGVMGALLAATALWLLVEEFRS